ncbi:hypothetical protein [Parabacteroides provencensis]|uniref:hypothetical protein n=1 Tax=Parabacteroides provencensis TaxID=1944636 RepID=UPI000C157AF1|nr:hypothetical protein [Parabacteroides provencensis]
MADVNEEKKSRRDNYLSRMKERMPDVDFDSEDPEVRYGAFEKYDDDIHSQLSQFKDNDSKLKDLFKKDPRFASFMSDIVGGDSPSSSFVKYFGKDVLDMSGDEEQMAKLNEANQEYLNRVAESNKLREDQDKNMEASAQDMSDFKAEKEMSDEEFEKFIGECYSVVEGALMGRIDKSFLETMYKGLNYEKDIQDAAAAGVVEGRNQKIDEQLKTTTGDGIPALNSGGKGGTKKPAVPFKRDFYS